MHIKEKIDKYHENFKNTTVSVQNYPARPLIRDKNKYYTIKNALILSESTHAYFYAS